MKNLKINNKLQTNVYNKISPKILSPKTNVKIFSESKKPGELMIKLRLLNKLSIEDICLKLDIPRKQYIELEKGEKIPDSHISYLLINIFNI